MCCNDNNTAAESVLDGLFTEAVATFGFPLRVRGDRGAENTHVTDYMINHIAVRLSVDVVSTISASSACGGTYSHCLYHSVLQPILFYGRHWDS